MIRKGVAGSQLDPAHSFAFPHFFQNISVAVQLANCTLKEIIGWGLEASRTNYLLFRPFRHLISRNNFTIIYDIPRWVSWQWKTGHWKRSQWIASRSRRFRVREIAPSSDPRPEFDGVPEFSGDKMEDHRIGSRSQSGILPAAAGWGNAMYKGPGGGRK
jgi:hypothetical protein